MTQSSGAPVAGEASIEVNDIVAWINSPEGRAKMLTGQRQAAETIAALKQARVVTFEQMNEPMTDFSRLAQPHRSEPDQGDSRARYALTYELAGEMAERFELHMGAGTWIDAAYRQDAATWAAAWKASEQRSAVGEPVAWQWRSVRPGSQWSCPCDAAEIEPRRSPAGHYEIRELGVIVPTASGDARDAERLDAIESLRLTFSIPMRGVHGGEWGCYGPDRKEIFYGETVRAALDAARGES